jgi:hypothetical protein
MDLGFWSIVTLLVGIPVLAYFTFSEFMYDDPKKVEKTGMAWFISLSHEQAVKKGGDALEALTHLSDEDWENEFKKAQGNAFFTFVISSIVSVILLGWFAGFFLYNAGIADEKMHKLIFLFLSIISMTIMLLSLSGTWKLYPRKDVIMPRVKKGTVLIGRVLDFILLAGLLFYAYLAIFG